MISNENSPFAGISPQAKPQNLTRPSSAKDKLKTLKSHFSDDEEEKIHQEERPEDILKIAKKLEKVQSARQDQMLKMASSLRGTSMMDNQEINELIEANDLKSSMKFEKEMKPLNKSPGQTEKSNQSPSRLPIQGQGDSDEEDGNVDEDEEEHEGKIKSIPATKVKNTLMSAGMKAPASNLPGMEGFLIKQSTNLLKLWQKRYYVLKEKKLYYYNKSKEEIKAGVIDFDLISVKLEVGKDKKQIKIIPVGGSRVFLLKAANEQEAMKWYEALEKHMQASAGSRAKLEKVVKLKKYWKDDRIPEAKFLQDSESGDILLFRTRHVGAQIQRSVTRSDYDHVGIILKYSNGEIVLFEATGKEGVGLCRWKTFMKHKWHLLYSKLVLRKLHIERNDELVGQIEKFVRYSVGKKYKITPAKLMKKRSTTPEDDDKTFFCSELVAACFKKMGLLPKDISAASYLPGAFAADRKLQLLNNAKLGDEYLIDFSI